jgi:N-acetylglucosamine-6-phosphate deacetylase
MTCSGRNVFTGLPVEVRFNGRITSVSIPADPPPANQWIGPGWIDIQVNGFAGVDYNTPGISPAQIALSLDAMFSAGVTRSFPTVITGPPDDMVSSLRNLWRARPNLKGGSMMEGFHVEGPHISPDDGPRGAHPRRWVRPPDLDEFRRWQDATDGNVRLVTLAPEWPQAPKYIAAIVAEGVVASIGHTNAEASQIADAVSAGATLSTHLGNGAHAVMRRHPNYIWDQLAEDRLMADFIVDGIHLSAPFLKVALRAKGIERSVLVTDAAGPAGARPGRYRLGEQDVDLTTDGRVVLAGQDKLAGSALRMDRGVENLIKLAGISLADAALMSTVNAAKAGKIEGRQRGLVAGERSDLILFRFDEVEKKIDVQQTWVGGELVFEACAET